VKNTHTGRIAQRSNSTDMSEVKEVTASMSSAEDAPHFQSWGAEVLPQCEADEGEGQRR
jgi:hypothetical protein